MKKHLLKLLLLCCVGILAISLFACVPSTEQYKLDFVVDGEVYHSRTTNGYSRINPPADPSKEGFIFCGWYFDEGVWDNEYFAYSLEKNPIKQDTAVYAKWEIDESHICKAGAWIIGVKATCKQEGNHYRACVICDKKMEVETIPVSTDHAEPYVVKEKVVNATCMATGSYVEVSYCTLCNRKLSEKNKTISIDENAHDYSNGTLTYADGKVTFSATCSNIRTNDKTGAIEEVCGVKVFVDNANVDKEVVKAATCTEEGTVKYVYISNGTTFKTDNINVPALGHKLCGVTIDDNKVYSEITDNEIIQKTTPYVNDKKCGEEITALFKCENCSQYCDITIAKPHSGAWVRTDAPTCHSSGKEQLAVCSECNAKDVVRAVAPTNNHVDGDYALRKVGNKFDLIVPCVNAADGCTHATVVLEDVQVTVEEIISKSCKVDDVIRYTYTDSDNNTVKLEISTSSGHFLDGVRASTLQSEDGWFDYRLVKPIDEEGGIKIFADKYLICGGYANNCYYVCETCDELVDVVVHRPHTGSWNTTKAATCTTEGLRIFYCDYCDYGHDGKVVEAIPVIEHSYAWELKIVESEDSIFAPFVLFGECYCGATDRIDNVLVTTKITRVSTCSVPGELTYIYIYDGVAYTTTRELPTIAHMLKGEPVEKGAKLEYAEYGQLVNVMYGEELKCGDDGVRAYYLCSECRQTVTVTLYREHAGEWDISLNESSTPCISTGTKTFACTYDGCGYTETQPYNSVDHVYVAKLTKTDSAYKLEIRCSVSECGYNATYDGVTDMKVTVKVAATCCADGEVEYEFMHKGVSYKILASVGRGNHVLGGVDYTTLLDADGKISADTEGLMIISDSDAAFKCDACEHVVPVKLKKD